MLTRRRVDDDGTVSEFTLLEYEGRKGPFRAEIAVHSLNELQQLRAAGVLIAIRMVGNVPGHATPQRNLVPVDEIEGW
jgi:hypothetical protein